MGISRRAPTLASAVQQSVVLCDHSRWCNNQRRHALRHICPRLILLWHADFHASKLFGNKSFKCFAVLRWQCLALLPLPSRPYHVYNGLAVRPSRNMAHFARSHPLLPMLHILAAKALYHMSARNHKTRINDPSNRSLPLQRGLLITLLISLPISCYIALLYCSAPMQLMAFNRNLPREDLRSGGVGFLMPCHSTPGHAYVHRMELADGRIWALGCEPPLH
ncbi:hypothetical protein B0H17DRAFT_1028701 [Mycena rosella]|uniref:Uncharacterized protein n=1 Tax=Mycena rosella TaxID=1033263 RepID=A0AAD7H1C2_MYCRO|nr:hypothetical protein B0H17DRAFT_1028701 [Mycena rosella]